LDFARHHCFQHRGDGSAIQAGWKTHHGPGGSRALWTDARVEEDISQNQHFDDPKRAWLLKFLEAMAVETELKLQKN
jgi:hypothetical protein